MASKVQQKSGGLSTPMLGMLVMALAGGVLVGLSFMVIVHWPVPVAVAPYYEDNLFGAGFTWGFVFGALIGWIVGFMTDESHFPEVTNYE